VQTVRNGCLDPPPWSCKLIVPFVTFIDVLLWLIICTYFTFAYTQITSSFLDGYELPSDGRQKVFPNGSLTISLASKSTDEGYYTCTAFNRRDDSDSGNVHIQVMSEYIRQQQSDSFLFFNPSCFFLFSPSNHHAFPVSKQSAQRGNAICSFLSGTNCSKAFKSSLLPDATLSHMVKECRKLSSTFY
jgi:hypothetical protein